MDSFNLVNEAFYLIVPLLVTLLVEWLMSLIFRLKRGRYVFIANLITNPIMNILLLVIYNFVYLDFYLILLLLEIMVAAFEFWFYTRRYKQHSKRRLLLFVIAANLASWGIYYLFHAELLTALEVPMMMIMYRVLSFRLF
jgi:hypothetical protein